MVVIGPPECLYLTPSGYMVAQKDITILVLATELDGNISIEVMC
jgi:hypothetical protein